MPEITMIGSDPSGVPAKAQIDGSGNLKVAVTGAGSGGTSSVDEAAFAASTSAGTPLMGAVTPGDTVASGKLAVAAMQVDRSINVYVTGQAGGGSAVSVADGADVTQGAIADAAVDTNTTGTISGKLRGLVKLLASVISVGRLVVDPSGVTSPVSAASLPLPTGAAAEAGNLATIVTNIGAVTASPTANTLMDRVKQLLTGIVLAAGANIIGAVTQSGTWNVGNGKTCKGVTGSASATFTIVAAVTSKRIKVVALELITASTTAVTVTFKDGASGTAIRTYPMQAITGTNFGFTQGIAVPGFLFATSAGTLLEMSFGAAQTVTYNLTYFDDDAT